MHVHSLVSKAWGAIESAQDAAQDDAQNAAQDDAQDAAQDTDLGQEAAPAPPAADEAVQEIVEERTSEGALEQEQQAFLAEASSENEITKNSEFTKESHISDQEQNVLETESGAEGGVKESVEEVTVTDILDTDELDADGSEGSSDDSSTEGFSDGFSDDSATEGSSDVIETEANEPVSEKQVTQKSEFAKESTDSYEERKVLEVDLKDSSDEAIVPVTDVLDSDFIEEVVMDDSSSEGFSDDSSNEDSTSEVIIDMFLVSEGSGEAIVDMSNRNLEEDEMVFEEDFLNVTSEEVSKILASDPMDTIDEAVHIEEADSEVMGDEIDTTTSTTEIEDPFISPLAPVFSPRRNLAPFPRYLSLGAWVTMIVAVT